MKNQLILAVGRRAFVHLPATAEHGDFEPCGHKSAATTREEPIDGQEVEILGWRPMAPGGLTYQIQRLSDHREWWARATCLRVAALAAVATERR